MREPIAVTLIACVAALLLTPVTARLAHVKGWVDRPGVRKVHRNPVAYLGGASVFAALLIALVFTRWLQGAGPFLEWPDTQIGAIVCGAIVMFVVGLADDIYDIRAVTKLIAQLSAALIVYASGVSIDGLAIADGVKIEFGIFGAVVTVFWIVGVTNAVNIIDGLDGLASGIAVVACGAISWTAFQGGSEPAGILMLALMGAILGFLPYNLHPARVFLGDAGSLTIGFLLSSTAALTATKAPTLMGLGVPMVALGIPILDTLFSMGRRLIERRSILSADRNHLHHRLMALGYGQPKTVLLLCTVTAVAVALTTISAPLGHLGRGAVLLAAFVTYTAVFRATGAVRLRDSVAAVGRVAIDAKTINDERQAVDHLGLELKESEDLEDWWGAVARAAEQLRFSRVELGLQRRDGALRTYEWTGDEESTSTNRAACEDVSIFEIPIPDRRSGPAPRLRVVVDSKVSLDVVGRRLGLFCKLMSENGIAMLPGHERQDGETQIGKNGRAGHAAGEEASERSDAPMRMSS